MVLEGDADGIALGGQEEIRPQHPQRHGLAGESQKIHQGVDGDGFRETVVDASPFFAREEDAQRCILPAFLPDRGFIRHIGEGIGAHFIPKHPARPLLPVREDI